ncbi:MAG: right-handed parallel beta-helix repeat-containing protein, partial [Candidatus Coatesbacteria bacterium]|nr:right-handed parallel beta-helix repeat-containing protein [Candidatus Coatesbacteria bacterium]
SPAIEHCVFTDNHADEGGAIYLDGSSPTIKDCRILNNTANENGGGLYCDGSNPIIWDTVVDGNSAGENGGGMFCDGSSPSDTKNCLFTSNTAGEDGGAVFCDNSSPSFLNCTFSLNEADGLGGALFLGSYCVPIVINSILWGDSPDEIWGHEEKKNSINITYSNVQQDGFGEDDCQPDDHYNISCNPDFAVRGDEEHDGYFLDQDESPSVSTGDTDKNPYGGYSNSTYVTDVVGYLDMTGGDDVDMGFHYKETGVAYIELASFAAYPDVNGIHIFWETATEIDNAGFALFRRAVDSAEYEQISGLIPSKGNLASGDSYYYFDTTAKATSSYLYSLIDVDTSGKWTVHGPVMARRLMVGLPDEGPLEAVQ